MYSVLFVCTGNQYRSPIAAEVFRKQLAHNGRESQWHVGSAGTWTSSGQPALREAVNLANSFGLNIERHVTCALDGNMLQEFGMVLVMEQGHKESIQTEFPFARQKVHLLSQILEGITYDIPDPAKALGESREIIGDLVAMIRGGYVKIYGMAEALYQDRP